MNGQARHELIHGRLLARRSTAHEGLVDQGLDHPHIRHRSMDMTLRYAKIANRTVADEYFAVTDQVDALYGQAPVLPADAIGPKMARLRREHHRLLGNGYCTRPAELDCAFESICETCTFFQTSIEFRPTLQAQHDDAAAKNQTGRQRMFDQLLHTVEQDAS